MQRVSTNERPCDIGDRRRISWGQCSADNAATAAGTDPRSKMPTPGTGNCDIDSWGRQQGQEGPNTRSLKVEEFINCHPSREDTAAEIHGGNCLAALADHRWPEPTNRDVSMQSVALTGAVSG